MRLFILFVSASFAWGNDDSLPEQFPREPPHALAIGRLTIERTVNGLCDFCRPSLDYLSRASTHIVTTVSTVKRCIDSVVVCLASAVAAISLLSDTASFAITALIMLATLVTRSLTLYWAHALTRGSGTISDILRLAVILGIERKLSLAFSAPGDRAIMPTLSLFIMTWLTSKSVLSGLLGPRANEIASLAPALYVAKCHVDKVCGNRKRTFTNRPPRRE